MDVQELRTSGLEFLSLVTQLLQRARLADPEAGHWEAADLQWWWRMPRRSDDVDQVVVSDDDGPVGAFVLTDWRDSWGLEPLVVPGAAAQLLPTLLARGIAAAEGVGAERLETLVRDDDVELVRLLEDAGYAETAERSGVMWMDAVERPGVASAPPGFRVVDRGAAASRPHPMRRRSGQGVEGRLRQCSLYDPWLDLAAEAPDGTVAGYALFWFDPVTKVGLVEPMRVEEAYQRRGLARALLTEGQERLARRGARRLKVGYVTEAARRLYLGAGFRVAATSTSYVRRTPAPAR